jgi:NTE family protein
VAAGIEPEIVCGTSIGALVGAAYVAGKLTELKNWAEAVTWREIVSLLDVRLSGGGLIDGRLIVEFLSDLGISQPIASYAKAYAAVATDLESGREIWLREGPIHEAVRASISLPGILSPATLGESWLVDGGLVNPVPVSLCRALGADIIIAVNLNGDIVGRHFTGLLTEPHDADRTPRHGELVHRLVSRIPAGIKDQVAGIVPRLLRVSASAPSYFDVLATSIDIMQDQITRTRLAGEPPHVMLVPRLQSIGLMEFNRAWEAIAEGRSCVERSMPIIRLYFPAPP